MKWLFLSLMRLIFRLPLLSSLRSIGTCKNLSEARNQMFQEVMKAQSTLPNGQILKRSHFPLLDSTQTLAKEICDDRPKELLKRLFDDNEFSKDTLYLISATFQTNSYGRSNSTWHSIEGDFLGTYMMYWPDTKVRYLPYASQAVGLAIAKTVEEYRLSAQIKWTNDVLVDGRKIAGILCEALPAADQGMMVLVGIGLNVNMKDQTAQEKYASTADELKLPFTSLAMAQKTTTTINLDRVSSQLSEHLSDQLSKVLSGRYASDLYPEILRRLAYRGLRVNYQDVNEGILERVWFEGITSDGFAILVDNQGERHVKMTGRIRPAES